MYLARELFYQWFYKQRDRFESPVIQIFKIKPGAWFLSFNLFIYYFVFLGIDLNVFLFVTLFTVTLKASKAEILLFFHFYFLSASLRYSLESVKFTNFEGRLWCMLTNVYSHKTAITIKIYNFFFTTKSSFWLLGVNFLLSVLAPNSHWNSSSVLLPFLEFHVNGAM